LIVLDTNVLSEVMRANANPIVVNWLDGQNRSSTFVTSITLAETLFGLELLPHGRRREALALTIDRMFREQFPGRVLPFDQEAAKEYSSLAGERKRAGRPISQSDAMIAAIARNRGLAIATRDEKGFAGCGVRIVNPWG
jgi:predicted nucleic acid-binding protein